MTSDIDPTLETDQLDQLLETAVQQQPVVVVQYRNRGIPPWIFVAFVIAVFPVALFVYHRTVRRAVPRAGSRGQVASGTPDQGRACPLASGERYSLIDGRVT